jgi:phosphatidylethanolamine N-methyltransferase
MLSRRFGIEFAPEVVKADGNVHNLALRICNAKRVLVCSHLPLQASSTYVPSH